MEIHRQTCQSCQSLEQNNILCREPGEHDTVVVICARCGAFVARYFIENRGYYHHGKGFESYLRSLNRGGEFSSGKVMMEEFTEVSQTAVSLYDRVKAFLKEKYR